MASARRMELTVEETIDRGIASASGTAAGGATTSTGPVGAKRLLNHFSIFFITGSNRPTSAFPYLNT
jgi:hypothetical protein